jgi:hypothetical protein
MKYLKSNGLIEDWRLTRRKLDLGPRDLGEFNLVMQRRDLAQLDDAFGHVATGRAPVESVHFTIDSKVTNLIFAHKPRFSGPRPPRWRREILRRYVYRP